MPIRKDLSDLPRTTAGTKPVTPRFVTAIAEAWYQDYLDAGKDTRAMSGETRFRGSDAGSCSYSLGLTLLERAGLGERSNPPDLVDAWRMGIGSMVHTELERILPKAFPGATCEVVGITLEGEASFHADVLITLEDGTKILVELKTINGTGFKSSVLGFRGNPPEGPRDNAILQGALAAEAFGCDELVIGYLALELVSVREAQRHGLEGVARFAAEWSYPPEVFIPLAEQERARFRWIAAMVDAGQMPDRTIPALPEGAIVTDPRSGAWSITDRDNPLLVLDIGTTWHCDYCWHRDACRSLAAQGR